MSVHTAAAATVAFRIVTESNMMAHGMGRTTFVVLGTASAKATSHGIATVRLHLADTTQTHATLQIAATLAGKVVRSSRQVVITPKK